MRRYFHHYPKTWWTVADLVASAAEYQAAPKYRYKCPIHGWRVLPKRAIVRDHGPCDPSLTAERLAGMKPIAPKEVK